MKDKAQHQTSLPNCNTTQLIDQLQSQITDEALKAAGLSRTHWSKPVVNTLIQTGTRHFATICAKFDTDISTRGLSRAVRDFVTNFIMGCYGYGMHQIPQKGPLLITSNHPGAADALTILALVNRDDVKLVISGVPFTETLPNTRKHLIYVAPDAQSRSQVIREIISHLRSGGAIFIFPTGHVTPDPELTPDPAVVFEDWSQSIALILKHVPETNLLMTTISGVIEKRFLHSPLCKIRRVKWRQQILAEFMQITWLMMGRTQVRTMPKVTFLPPITGEELLEDEESMSKVTRSHLHQAILNRAQMGLERHIGVNDAAEYITFP